MQKAHGLIREIVRYIGIRLEVSGEGWGFGVGGLGIAFGLWGSQEKVRCFFNWCWWCRLNELSASPFLGDYIYSFRVGDIGENH